MHPLVDVIIPGELAPGESFAQALSRHPDRDVVIADSRSRVNESLLARLAACARTETSTATVSVFSGDGPLAYRAPLAEKDIDALFARENAGIPIEIPSAVPPCVYVTRRALDECGTLDGDNPESMLAFCERASEAGLRHRLCADAYVAHGADGQRFARWNNVVDANSALARQWADFAQRAPDVPPRRRVDVARLRASTRPRLLFVTHDWGGGVELHVRDLAKMLADDCEVLVLRPGKGGSARIQWLREGETLQAWFETETQWDACEAFLKSLGVARVHIHHVHGLPKKALDLPRVLGVPFDITLHDHFAICPQYHLADPQGAYCGEPDKRGCDECIAKRPVQWVLDITAWRALFHRVLREAARVIVPSQDVATRLERYYPDLQPQVWPHPQMRLLDAPLIYKVVLLGGLSAIKGMDLFEACVRDAAARALPLHFQVLGHTSRPLEVEKGAPVTVLGSYRDERLATLVALEHPDAFLFLSQVPESFSYTLSVAMHAGQPIVATDLGAFTERLRGYPAASLVPHDASARTVNDTLLRLLKAPAAQPRPIAISQRA